MVRLCALSLVSLTAGQLTCGPGADYPAPPARLPLDKFRPRVHFAAPHGWMNDIIRPTFIDGEYHVFYQHNPCGSTWGNMSWGHATTPDLMTWNDMPIALWPEHDYEAQGGVFTGSVVALEGSEDKAAALYTGAARMPISWSSPYDLLSETVVLATSADADLKTWTKGDENPVMPQPPQDLLEDGKVCVTGFRDPYVTPRRDANGALLGYNMLISGGFRQAAAGESDVCSGSEYLGGAAFHFESNGTKLDQWNYAGVALSHDVSDFEGKNWECVSSVNFPEQNASLMAFGREPDHLILYSLGSYDADKQFFVAADEPAYRAMDFGVLYAGSLFEDHEGRRLIMGWVDEIQSDDWRNAAGWSGMLSLPRELQYDSDRKALRQLPYSALTALRGARMPLPLVALTEEFVVNDPEIIGDNVYEIQLNLNCTQTSQEPAALVKVLRSHDATEATAIAVSCPADGSGAKVDVDRSKSSSEACKIDGLCQNVSGEAEFADSTSVAVTILVDASIIEVFFDGSALTTRAYPSNATGLSVTAAPGVVSSAELWNLRLPTIQQTVYI